MASHLEDVEYKNGKKHGPWVLYYADGGKRREGAFDMGKKTGKWIEYHRNGQPASINHYRENQLTGDHVAYYENGKRKQTGPIQRIPGQEFGRAQDGHVDFLRYGRRDGLAAHYLQRTVAAAARTSIPSACARIATSRWNRPRGNTASAAMPS